MGKIALQREGDPKTSLKPCKGFRDPSKNFERRVIRNDGKGSFAKDYGILRSNQSQEE
jgi:hypothetical protein